MIHFPRFQKKQNQGNKVSCDLNYICSGTCYTPISEVQIRICCSSLGNFCRRWLSWPFNPARFFHWRTEVMDCRKDWLQSVGYEQLTWIIAIPNYQCSDPRNKLQKSQSQQQPVYLRRTVWAMAALSQRTTFGHWKYSHYNACCPLSEAKASVQQCPSTSSHCGVRDDCFVIHSGQRLLWAKDIEDVVEAPFCHAAQYGLSLTG